MPVHAGRVLVVEDDPATLRAVVRILSPEWDTVSVSNGQVALRALENQQIDVVLTDIAMPTMDGLALLQNVRRVSREIPVVLMTGNPSVEAVELGAFKCLSKPLDAATLRDTVRNATRHGRMARMRRQALEVANHLEPGVLRRTKKRVERARETLWVAYQPIVDRRRRVFGYEALMRYSEGIFESPRELLAAADDIGVADELGQKMRTLAPRPFESLPDVLLFLNIDPDQMHQPHMDARNDGLADMADRVVLELTEHVSLKHVPDPEAAILRLKSVGYRLAVDDLGAGYSGLASFAQIGPDFVKLDRGLVRGVGGDPDRQRVIAGISRLCHELDMRVIAEGVEDGRDLTTLIALDCDLFQGYLLGRPSPLG
jgi:EAL domain-containing protein (putative c-di-GMP-specific phosphodiesterase class I)